MTTLPGDKSMSHRALLLAALADGPCELHGISPGDDVKHTMAAMRTLGASIRVDDENDGLHVRVEPPTTWQVPEAPIDCGNSGTLMRLLTGALVGQQIPATLIGDASLSRRPMARVTEPLCTLADAVVVTSGPLGTPPVTTMGKELTTPDADITVDTRVSSAQVKSALLFAALGRAGITRVREPVPTRAHTETMFRFTGLPLEMADDVTVVVGRGARRPRAFTLTIPKDPSAALFHVVEALLAHKSARLENVLACPHRTRFVDVLANHGVDVWFDDCDLDGPEPVGSLVVDGALTSALFTAAELAPSLVDEIPGLAALAAGTAGTHRFCGLAELRVKESDRLALIVENLQRFGISAIIEADDLIIHGQQTSMRANAHTPVSVVTHGDHRIAMAMAVLARARRQPVVIDDVACIATSDPYFLAAMTHFSPP